MCSRLDHEGLWSPQRYGFWRDLARRQSMAVQSPGVATRHFQGASDQTVHDGQGDQNHCRPRPGPFILVGPTFAQIGDDTCSHNDEAAYSEPASICGHTHLHADHNQPNRGHQQQNDQTPENDATPIQAFTRRDHCAARMLRTGPYARGGGVVNVEQSRSKIDAAGHPRLSKP
jgi:hypothetical protein